MLIMFLTGFGEYCKEICANMAGYCAYDIKVELRNLSPEDHLKRIYRYCFSHSTRRVKGLRGHVSDEVCTAMMSLASADALPDVLLKEAMALIRAGGKKSAGIFVSI